MAGRDDGRHRGRGASARSRAARPLQRAGQCPIIDRIPPPTGSPMPAVTVQIPDELAACFDTPEALERALFEDFVIEQRLEEIRQGHISLGKAAELLGLNQSTLLGILAARGLGPINADADDLARSWERFSTLMTGR
jgi:predicted HTH domain antitoxin